MPRPTIRFLVLLLAAGFPAAAASQVNPVSWRTSLSPLTVSPGASATVRVAASIDSGWHVYSATQPAGGPMATTVELIENQSVHLSGKLSQGKFETKNDPVFDMKVEAFSNEAWFEVPVRVDSRVRPGKHEAQIRVRYQACSGRICLLPAERLLALKFTVIEAMVATKPVPDAKVGSASKPTAKSVNAVPAKPADCTLKGSIRGFYTEIAHLMWTDPDRHRQRIVCVPAVLGRASPKGDEQYFAALLWLRYDREEASRENFEKAATLLEGYLSGSAPLIHEESALANLVSSLVRVERFEDAKNRYHELKAKYQRRSIAHEQWPDTTNVAWAGRALMRSLADAKRYAEAELIAREDLDYLKERESSLAWTLAAQASVLLRSLEEQGKGEAAAAVREELASYFAQHGEKYPAAADFWLTSDQVKDLEKEDPKKALAVLEGKRDAYRKAGFERSYDQTVNRLRLYDSRAPELEAALWLNSDALSLRMLQGKVILLDFWASWCKPCREDFPALEELSKRRAADGLVVIGVTQNDGWFMTADGKTLGRGEGGKLTWEKEAELVSQFVRDFKMTMPVLVGRRPEDPKNPFASAFIVQSYGVQVLPTTVLIDRQGVVRYIGEREGEKYESTLARLLEERTSS